MKLYVALRDIAMITMTKTSKKRTGIPLYVSPDAEFSTEASCCDLLCVSKYDEEYDGVGIESPNDSGSIFNW